MIPQLFIWLTENTSHTYEWGVSKQGVFTSMPASALSDISQHIQADPNEVFDVVVLLPGDAIFSTVITVPEQQAKYLQQSLPFLVEESLTEDIADLYLLLGPKVERNQYVVMGITRAKFEQWLADLKVAHIAPRVMIADHTCCPANTVIITAEKGLLRLSEHQSQTIDVHNVGDFLTHFIASNHCVSLQWMIDSKIQLQAEPWIQLVEEGLVAKNVIVTKQHIDSPLQVLAQQFSQAPAYYQAINFLQGKYALKTTQKTPLHRWRQVGLLVGALLVLNLALNMAQGIYLGIKTAQVEKQSKQFYKALFPSDTVTDNVRAQMMGKLKLADSSNAKGAFLDTYSQIVTVIQKNQLQSVIDIAQVSFDDDKGEVHVELLAKNIEQITQLKDLLVKESLKAEIGSTSNEANKTKASLKIWQ